MPARNEFLFCTLPFPRTCFNFGESRVPCEHQTQDVTGFWMRSRSGQCNHQEAGTENSLVCLGRDLLAGLSSFRFLLWLSLAGALGAFQPCAAGVVWNYLGFPPLLRSWPLQRWCVPQVLWWLLLSSYSRPSISLLN